MLLLLSFVIGTGALFGQQGDFGVVGGAGISAGDDQDRRTIAAAGASFGWPYRATHRVQADYLFNHVVREGDEGRHFVTGSYVLQGRRGRSRPFLQFGGGVLVQTFRFGRLRVRDTSFAAVFGGGFTVDIGRSLFIRPHVRVMAHVGPTVTLLPAVTFGFRF